MTILEITLTAYALVGCAYWLRMALGAVRVVGAVPRLADVNPPQPAVWPKLSVVIPACNEADQLESAVTTILGQDYPNLEIVLVDDRSTDGTGEIVDRIAASDRRVQALHVAELPDRWLGKVHALQRGLEQAGGQWLLFTDADVHYAGDMLRRAVAYCEHRGLDHLAAVPEMRPTKFLVDVGLALFLRTFCVFMRCWAIENPRSRAFIGVGAFNLVRRSAFERTEGFPWLRLEVADDVGLGLMMKRSGAHSCIVNAVGLIALQWYPTLGAVARGSEKAFASLAECRLWRLLVVCFFVTALELAPLVVLAPVGHWRLLPATLVMLAAGAVSILVLGRWVKGRLWLGFLFPLAVVLNVFMLLRSGWLGCRRGGIVWRGTFYPSEVLRQGIRVRFP